MSDLRELLRAAAPSPGELDLDRVHHRGRQRRRRPRLAIVALGVFAVVVGAVAIIHDRGGDGRRIAAKPSPTTTSPPNTLATPTTTPVDPAATDPASSLPADIPRCQAQDLRFLDARYDLQFFFLRFRNQSGRDCALLSYPTLYGRDANGTWVEIPTQHQAIQPVSSFAWTGLISASPLGNPPLLLRLQIIPPTDFPGSRCPGPPIPTQHFSGLQLVLRDDQGSIDLDDTQYDIGGCAVAMTLFGYDSTDR